MVGFKKRRRNKGISVKGRKNTSRNTPLFEMLLKMKKTMIFCTRFKIETLLPAEDSQHNTKK